MIDEKMYRSISSKGESRVSLYWEERRDMEQVLFRWQGLQTLEAYLKPIASHFYTRNNVLIYVTGGSADWTINEQVIRLEPGSLAGIAAGSQVEIIHAVGFGLKGWVIDFCQYEVLHTDPHGGELMRQKWSVPAEGPVVLAILAEDEVGEQLEQLAFPGKGRSGIERELIRQQLLYLSLDTLYKAANSGEQTGNQAVKDKQIANKAADQAVLNSIDYVHQHYDKPLTREAMAKLADLSPWHYSRKFRAMTGKPPLEYLNQYRIFRAQERLLMAGALAQDVAKQVGFEDAYYFSRRFKQFTGVSPKSYVRSVASSRICVLSATYAESLLALGIVPHSVLVVPLLLPEHQRKAFERHGVKMIPVPQYMIDYQAIQTERTQFIVSPMISEGTRRHLMTIAPMAIGFAADMMGAISQLAVLFRREREAERVYAAISAAAAEARNQLADVIRTRATVMVLRVEPFGYRYLGAHSFGVSRILYRELGLTIPSVLNEGQGWFNPLRLEQLPLANPRYIFVENRITEGEDNQQSLQALMSSKYWRQLDAVQNNRVFHVETGLWVNGCGPIGHAEILRQIIASITKQAAQ